MKQINSKRYKDPTKASGLGVYELTEESTSRDHLDENQDRSVISGSSTVDLALKKRKRSAQKVVTEDGIDMNSDYTVETKNIMKVRGIGI